MVVGPLQSPSGVVELGGRHEARRRGMADRTQKLSIRLLREGVEPSDATRSDVILDDWPKIEGAKILFETIGGLTPKWAEFLELSDAEKAELTNSSAAALVFLKASERWFVICFGLGHVKLDPAKFEQDFGLRVVMNSVDPDLIRSADVKTPDENTLSRRSQTSRGSDQTAFAFDIERDIIRGLAGKPKDLAFATRVAGSDGLIIDRKVNLGDLSKVCTEAYEIYLNDEYQKHFKWVDQIKHVRDTETIVDLRKKLVEKMNHALVNKAVDDLNLAFPIIYDPEKGDRIQYKGFRSALTFSDLDISGYFEALADKSKDTIGDQDLDRHSVHEVNDEGRDIGGKWSILDCIATEIYYKSGTYVLSSGRWYKVDADLAKDVSDFFSNTPKLKMPSAKAGENEETYNKRQKLEHKEFICLDRKLIIPTGFTTSIEVCDFLSKKKEIIHVKDKTSSSRLSHLFNQGTVSGRVLAMDGPARDSVRSKVFDAEKETGLAGFSEIIPDSTQSFLPSNFTIVYAVITAGHAKLPFFSLLTFRQAVRELLVFRYNYAFSWIVKPDETGAKKKKSIKTS